MTTAPTSLCLCIVALFCAAGPSDPTTGPSAGKPTTPAIEYRGTLLVQLRVADLDRSIAFYRDVMGFDLKSRNDELRWAKLHAGIDRVTVGIGEGPDVSGSGTTSMNFGVADVDIARRTLESKGVHFHGETTTIPGVVKLADLQDPDGNRIRLAQALDTAPADLKGEDSTASAALSRFQWLTGTWRANQGDDVLEEIWSAPHANSMMGIFRWVKGGKTWMNELMTITATDGAVVFRLRHFSAAMVPWEDRDAAFEYPLLSEGPTKAVFENEKRDSPRRFVYERDHDSLTIRLEGDSSEPGRAFHYYRVHP